MLDSDKVGADEGNMIHLTEHANNTSVVNARNKDSQQIGKECWLLLEVECQRLVVTAPSSALAHRDTRNSTYISTLATRTMISLN
jgi:hypothetical protein